MADKRLIVSTETEDAPATGWWDWLKEKMSTASEQQWLYFIAGYMAATHFKEQIAKYITLALGGITP